MFWCVSSKEHCLVVVNGSEGEEVTGRWPRASSRRRGPFAYMKSEVVILVTNKVLKYNMKINTNSCYSLVPRPQPVTRRNSLVNQVESIGLAHTFAAV